MDTEFSVSLLLQHLPGVVYRCKLDSCWTMEYLSFAVKELTGYFPEDFLRNGKQSYADLIHPNDRENVQQEIKNAVSAGTPFKVSYRITAANGQLKWVWEQGQAIQDKTGKVIALEGFITDITAYKQTEEALRASEERYRSLVESCPDGMLVVVNGIIVYSNYSATQIFAANAVSDLIGHPLLAFFNPEVHDLANREQLIIALEESSSTQLADLRWRRLDGVIMYVQLTTSKVTWEGQPAIQILLRDITAEKQTQDTLRRVNERLQLAIEGTGRGIWDWNLQNDTYRLSGGLKKMLDWEEEEPSELPVNWQDFVHPDDLPNVMERVQACIQGKIPNFKAEYRIRTRNGAWKWVRSRGVIVERDAEGKPLIMTGTKSDITSRKEADELAWRHAYLDTLTSVPNRRLFPERLETELLRAKRTKHAVALLYIDLDGFKQVNDFLGHDAGDMLLMEVAQRLKHCVRESDTVARLGGDEFTVILTELNDLGHVEFVCQKILFGLAQPFSFAGDMSHISASIGVSLYPFDATSVEDLIRKADQAMYVAKQSGKNQFHYFTQEMDKKAHFRLLITNELRSALTNQQLSVHYQPVVDLHDGHVFKAEALLRWHHPKLGDIQPSDFIPLAEESGLIKDIGNWAFQEAARCCKHCTDEIGAPFRIGVNKSPVQFMVKDNDSDWLHFLAELGLSCNSITVEITEGVLLIPSIKVEEQLLAYRDAGVQIALDDFGTGYSSMSYLQKLNIDYLKIDQSFVKDIAVNLNSRTIAESIIAMAHKMGVKVIAEGIETQEQLQCLKDASCDYGQGFLFAHPLPETGLVQLLLSSQQLGSRIAHA
jgi:diguanylate cyclase (GGDEF)-like protein/PAS domain S-box-containing protein